MCVAVAWQPLLFLCQTTTKITSSTLINQERPVPYSPIWISIPMFLAGAQGQGEWRSFIQVYQWLLTMMVITNSRLVLCGSYSQFWTQELAFYIQSTCKVDFNMRDATHSRHLCAVLPLISPSFFHPAIASDLSSMSLCSPLFFLHCSPELKSTLHNWLYLEWQEQSEPAISKQQNHTYQDKANVLE